jgi:predicted signal transduction protein with EAL and GGDEF domain
VDEPFLVDGISLRTGVSIGIALFPDDDLDLSGLLRKADIAMYRAKTLSTGHHVYCIADDPDDAARLLMVDSLRIAMTGDQLVVPCQPTIQPVTSEVHSLEALIH